MTVASLDGYPQTGVAGERPVKVAGNCVVLLKKNMRVIADYAYGHLGLRVVAQD